MYKRMLVPLDASEYAECTLDHVKEVAAAHNVEQVVLLNVVEPMRQPALAHYGSERAEELDKKAHEAAKEYLQKTRDRLGASCAVNTAVVDGQPAAAILDYIEKNGVDLVIMSSHGHTGLSKWFIGSVAEKVLQRSPVPVFLIPSIACRFG
ncbi:MAG: universal stress protein [Chloroflexota bacterium]